MKFKTLVGAVIVANLIVAGAALILQKVIAR